LKELCRDRLFIHFGVTDSASRAHYLHVAGLSAAAITETISMRDGSLTNIGHNLNVHVWMKRKAGAGRNLIVVPHIEIADGPMDRIAISANGEMVQCPEPAMISSPELRPRTMLDQEWVPTINCVTTTRC